MEKREHTWLERSSFKKLTFSIALVVIISAPVHSQNWLRGYVVDDGGTRIDGLIAEENWKINPAYFVFKVQEKDKPDTLGIELLKEAAVGYLHFIKAEVQYDTSSQVSTKLSTRRSPEWKTGTLFLRVLVEGEASLYYYRSSQLRLFFYKTYGTPIRQLVFKRYNYNEPDGAHIVASNLTYINQLANDLPCPIVPELTQDNMQYQMTPLVNYFIAYHKSQKTGYTLGTAPESPFTLKAQVGLDFSTMKWTDVVGTRLPFPDGKSIRVGLDAGYKLPYGQKRIDIFIAPTFQNYTATRPLALKYRSIETPVGVRYHLTRSSKARLFVDGSFVVDLPTRFELDLSSNVQTRVTGTLYCFAAGAGVTVHRLSAEARYYSRRKGTDDYFDLSFEYAKTSFILSYRLN